MLKMNVLNGKKKKIKSWIELINPIQIHVCHMLILLQLRKTEEESSDTILYLPRLHYPSFA